jgi:hypothetical protein
MNDERLPSPPSLSRSATVAEIDGRYGVKDENASAAARRGAA